ncbi:hypothetical protein C8R45DRAFT_922715 [Mycena sanguinolenta]|nr:hypothetical protein C8R45DRAFT_922715 [Mycena sanguinolenta]
MPVRLGVGSESGNTYTAVACGMGVLTNAQRLTQRKLIAKSPQEHVGNYWDATRVAFLIFFCPAKPPHKTFGSNTRNDAGTIGSRNVTQIKCGCTQFAVPFPSTNAYVPTIIRQIEHHGQKFFFFSILWLSCLSDLTCAIFWFFFGEAEAETIKREALRSRTMRTLEANSNLAKEHTGTFCGTSLISSRPPFGEAMIAPRTTLESRGLACRTEQYYVPKIHTDARLDRTGGREDGELLHLQIPRAGGCESLLYQILFVFVEESAWTKAFSFVQRVAGINSQHLPARIERCDRRELARLCNVPLGNLGHLTSKSTAYSTPADMYDFLRSCKNNIDKLQRSGTCRRPFGREACCMHTELNGFGQEIGCNNLLWDQKIRMNIRGGKGRVGIELPARTHTQ